MENLIVKEHGLKGKPNNKHAKKQDIYESINTALHKFFKDLEGEVETHATRVIHDATGISVQDEEINLVELLFFVLQAPVVSSLLLQERLCCEV